MNVEEIKAGIEHLEYAARFLTAYAQYQRNAVNAFEARQQQEDNQLQHPGTDEPRVETPEPQTDRGDSDVSGSQDGQGQETG